MAELHRLDILAKDENEIAAVTGLLAVWLAAGWEEIAQSDGGLVFRTHAENREFLENLARQLKLAAPGVGCVFSDIQERNWGEAWREFFTPVECGDRFVALPPWLANANFGDRIKIIIEPASAFGTGHHATTALCLTALSDLLDAGACKAGQSFLDLGCGSGILGIGAALSGMHGLGLDNDILAIENALQNRALNGAEDLELQCGSLELATGRRFGLVMANILSGPLIDMAPQISALAEPGGFVMLSGILDSQAGKVAQAYEACGRKLVSSLARDEWRLLLFE